jgi:hypothetical protein
MPKVEKTTKSTKCETNCTCKPNISCGGSGSGSVVYCLGIIGSLVYYLSQASVFSDYLWGIGKSFVWPAILVYQALTLLAL